MNVEVSVPMEFGNQVMSELNSRSAVIKGTDARDDYTTIYCEVSLKLSWRELVYHISLVIRWSF